MYEFYILLSLKEHPAAIIDWNIKQKQKQGEIKNPPHRVNKTGRLCRYTITATTVTDTETQALCIKQNRTKMRAAKVMS